MSGRERAWAIDEKILKRWEEVLEAEGSMDVIYTREEIEEAIIRLADEINRTYQGKVDKDNPLVVICVLTGALYFFSELIKRLEIPIAVDFLDVSSYSGRTSSGVIRIEKDLDMDVEGKHLLVVEDIVDTGLTLSYLENFLLARNPASLRFCVLFDKEESRKIEVNVDFVGLKVPKRFLVGYGLDYDDYYRNSPIVIAYRNP